MGKSAFLLLLLVISVPLSLCAQDSRAAHGVIYDNVHKEAAYKRRTVAGMHGDDTSVPMQAGASAKTRRPVMAPKQAKGSGLHIYEAPQSVLKK